VDSACPINFTTRVGLRADAAPGAVNDNYSQTFSLGRLGSDWSRRYGTCSCGFRSVATVRVRAGWISSLGLHRDPAYALSPPRLTSVFCFQCQAAGYFATTAGNRKEPQCQVAAALPVLPSEHDPGGGSFRRKPDTPTALKNVGRCQEL
jgi:hypothetical protein